MHPAERMQPDDDKLAELILYISEECYSDPGFGKMKLNKVLFAVDLIAYLELGKSITGQEYQKLDHGPAPRRLLPVVRNLEGDKKITFAHHKRYGYTQQRPVALCDADLSRFSGKEVAIIGRVIEEMWGWNAAKVSEWSHDIIGWQIVNEGETIPFRTVFVDHCPELTSNEKEYAQRLARGLGLKDEIVGNAIPF